MSVKASRRWAKCGKKQIYIREVDRGYVPLPSIDLVAEGVRDYEDELDDDDAASLAFYEGEWL